MGQSLRETPAYSLLTRGAGDSRVPGLFGRDLLVGYASTGRGLDPADLTVLVGTPTEVAFAAADEQLMRNLALLALAALLAFGTLGGADPLRRRPAARRQRRLPEVHPEATWNPF